MDRAKLRSELKRDEGLRLRSYRDTVGKWTIGYGHLLGDTERMTQITLREAEALLEVDIDDAIEIMRVYVNIALNDDDVRTRALVNMAFNLGNRLGTFVNTLAAINRRDWEKAADGMLASKWARQVGRRAVDLAHMIRTGEDPK